MGEFNEEWHWTQQLTRIISYVHNSSSNWSIKLPNSEEPTTPEIGHLHLIFVCHRLRRSIEILNSSFCKKFFKFQQKLCPMQLHLRKVWGISKIVFQPKLHLNKVAKLIRFFRMVVVTRRILQKLFLNFLNETPMVDIMWASVHVSDVKAGENRNYTWS